MYYCKAYFNFNRNLSESHVLRFTKVDNRIFQYFAVQEDENFAVVNGNKTDNFYPVELPKLRVIK